MLALATGFVLCLWCWNHLCQTNLLELWNVFSSVLISSVQLMLWKLSFWCSPWNVWCFLYLFCETVNVHVSVCCTNNMFWCEGVRFNVQVATLFQAVHPFVMAVIIRPTKVFSFVLETRLLRSATTNSADTELIMSSGPSPPKPLARI